jgi:hypothetical protein
MKRVFFITVLIICATLSLIFAAAVMAASEVVSGLLFLVIALICIIAVVRLSILKRQDAQNFPTQQRHARLHRNSGKVPRLCYDHGTELAFAARRICDRA